jgi:hypothetical protein
MTNPKRGHAAAASEDRAFATARRIGNCADMGRRFGRALAEQ